MKEALKSIGSKSIILAIGIAGIVVLSFVFKGGIWFCDKVYDLLILISAISIIAGVVLFLPLSLFKRTRGFSGIGLVSISYVFGITLWVWCLLTTYTLWGGFWTFVGVAMGGIGVLPMAFIAAALKGIWALCGQIIGILILTFVTRMFGCYLVALSEKQTL
jgi:hypothetical protein